MPLFYNSKVGKGEGNNLIVIAIIVVAAFLLSQNSEIFATPNLFPVTGVFANHTWTGDRQAGDSATPCGVSGGIAFSDNSMVFDFTSAATGSCTPVSASLGRVSTDLEAFSGIDVDFSGTAKGTCVPRGSSGGASFNFGNSNGVFFSIGTESCIRDTVSKSGTLRVVKNVAGELDSFLKECVSCNFQYVNTVPFSSTFSIAAGADGGGASGNVHLEVTRFEVIESIDLEKLIREIERLETNVTFLQSTLAEKAAALKDLELTVAEYSEIIKELELRVEEEAAVANDLQLSLEELVNLTNSLELEVEQQLVFINNLNINLATKEVLVSQLRITNEEQERLVAEMRGSFAEQADVIDALNLTLQDDAELISSLRLSLQAQAGIMDELGLTIMEMEELIGFLKLSNAEKIELIKSLKLNLEEQDRLITALEVEEPFIDASGSAIFPEKIPTTALLFVGLIVGFFVLMRIFER